MPYEQKVPVLAGYITRAASASDFDINSVRILCGVKAGGYSILPYDAAIAVVKCPVEAHLLGDRFAVRYTVRDRGRNVIHATRIDK